jgi:hypothetical protein
MNLRWLFNCIHRRQSVAETPRSPVIERLSALLEAPDGAHSIDLSGQKSSIDTIVLVKQIIFSPNHHIHTLQLARAQVSTKQVSVLVTSITKSSFAAPCTITCIDLSHNPVGSKGTKSVASILSNANCKVTALGLAAVNLTGRWGDEGSGLIALSRALFSNSSLRKLDLSCNNIGRRLDTKKGKWIADLEGTRILAQAFQGHSLESVQLARYSSRLL